MPPAPEGRVPKRRRTSDDVEAGSSQQPSRWVKKAKRATGELRKLLREANGVHELVTKTEQAIARASESVKNMVHDVDMLDARRTASSRANRTRQSTAVPIHSTPAHETASLPSVPRSGTDAEKTSDLQAALVALIKARVDENKDTDKRSMDGVLRSVLDALIDADPRENTTCCTCRPTASQRRRIEETKFSKPRPRIGADAQGFPYDDRSACSMSDPHPDRLTSKERNVEKMLALGRPDPFMDSLPGLSVRPRPRAPRVFKQQFTVQFQHLPPGVLAEMERWHVELGRCGNCIMRAMRTFPPWIIEVEWPAVAEDGCPVYENRAKAEVAEWDEERRQWRHLILDHYRWIPVEELEERPSDSAADPEVVNGTAHASIPWDALIDYDALNE
ncbi:hypothetical protein PUNSTDRAFT_138915 [Punctularia strigosozonata HHB-11173 SS5]|uniref:Uncharacterized protein n=1 Tax=Punctularia strigosozonata (strain HHB-11173) TaxID=741275 RepID=R7S2W7_PUNST|nr:uncharacterized protein PUNSTDRAFT_138915 [Punctularia strigosozonata HHB-11173 SS5]EIN04189.1 hypothetical protein PUNSTDRAFT_138915 [Punctularia strigosozonata HHB-11173 SS5]